MSKNEEYDPFENGASKDPFGIGSTITFILIGIFILLVLGRYIKLPA
jgi:hypothetical protein